jgi:hypothetical protein
MKIIDIVPSRKITEVSQYSAESKKAQIKKRGYFYDFHIISYQEQWFWNNAEKDIVVAYYQEEFVKIVVCKKGKKDYRCFSVVDVGRLGFGRYSVFSINMLSLQECISILNRLTDKVRVIDKDELERAERLCLLNSLESNNG